MSDTSTALRSEADSALARFIAPPERTVARLDDPRFTALLAAISEELAPGGVATAEADRYAASAIETHLEARRRVVAMRNALLKP